MKVLVLVAQYPNNDGGIGLMYVHTRNVEYINQGIDTTVLNFAGESEYIIDGIRVINEEIFRHENIKYDLLILHAANLRNHYRFLKKYDKQFEKMLFFYHGHEVMKINKQYSKPYDYVKKSFVKTKMEDLYDIFKLSIWKKYLIQNMSKCYFIFVSQWMKNVFHENIGYVLPDYSSKSYITYNCVGRVFEEKQYDNLSEKKFDFVTIRGALDGSKYAVDVVNKLAKNTPSAKFLLIGKGEFFKHHMKSENIEWRDTWLNQEEIVEVLQTAKYALMPTRTDAQGLMACEMAAFGIPVITSDIDVCHEIFDGFCNAFFINNDLTDNLNFFINHNIKVVKDVRYYKKYTVAMEINTIRKVIEDE